MTMTLRKALLLLLTVALVSTGYADREEQEDEGGKRRKRMSLSERRQKAKEAAAKYAELRNRGVDEVSNTEDAKIMRNYQLRKKKQKGFIRKKETTLSEVLFPGVAPEDYSNNDELLVQVDLVESRKTHVPFEFYDMPVCSPVELTNKRKQRMRRNLGSKLQGHAVKPAPFAFRVKNNQSCKPICSVNLGGKKLRWLRKLVARQYRVHMTLDSLPVLMRSKELNYAVRGYPVGFKAPPSFNGLKNEEFYLYNHLRFTITYWEDPELGVRITGFDVHPVSIDHKYEGELKEGTIVDTCNADSSESVVNDPKTYMMLKSKEDGEPLSVVYSYEVNWVESDLQWSDRWDVYLIGSPDDDIHYFAIVNSLMVVLFLTGAVATIMIRTLRKDIAGYNEMQTIEETQEETGWKLVHGDVFRPPSFSPMVLSVAVGTGAQIGSAFFFALIAALFGLLNPMNKGQTLTALIILFALCGIFAGYVSARLYKLCDAKAWKQNTMVTASAFPGVMVAIFMVLNMFLTVAGAATAVSIWTILLIFLLWVCLSTPLVFIGSYVGFRSEKMEVPTKTNQIARVIPEMPWYTLPPFSMLLGGVLPFGSVCIELFFIMSALWLHQIYYVMGFLLAVLLILGATCAEVAMVMCYLQLCAEDHRWWWKSFWNCATAGVYLFLYALWFLSSRLDLVGYLPVVVYLTYMSMISVVFGLFCGAVGVLSCVWFNKTIYGAIKVD